MSPHQHGNTISVVMGTYNGASHLKEQLESIAVQTRPPDELIVCDDASVDGSPEIVRRFSSAAPFPVRLVLNDTNLGPAKNYERGIAMCTGDLIAPADQDDVWLPHKLARAAGVFSARPAVGLVCGDSAVVDRSLRPLGYTTLHSMTRDNKRVLQSPRAIELLIRRNFVQGGTLVFRSRFRDVVLPFPDLTWWKPDGWVGAVMAGVADMVFLDEPLLLYRQHPGQMLGAPPIAADGSARRAAAVTARGHIVRQDDFRFLLERLTMHAPAYPQAKESAARVQQYADHARTRRTMPARFRTRLPVVLGELVSLRYHYCSNGMASAAKDLLGLHCSERTVSPAKRNGAGT